MTTNHTSDCATSNAPAYVPGPCDCTPTPAMCRAAVEYMNGPEVYGKLPAEALAIEEGIYAEVWKAMRAVAPSSIDSAVTPSQVRQLALEEAAKECDHLQRATLASQDGDSASLENVMLRQVATLGHAECARAIRRLAAP